MIMLMMYVAPVMPEPPNETSKPTGIFGALQRMLGGSAKIPGEAIKTKRYDGQKSYSQPNQVLPELFGGDCPPPFKVRGFPCKPRLMALEVISTNLPLCMLEKQSTVV